MSNTGRAGQLRAEKEPLDLGSRRSLEAWRGAISVEEFKNLMHVAPRISGTREEAASMGKSLRNSLDPLSFYFS